MDEIEYPLISALMLAQKRDHKINVPRAIEYFERQTYPYKELIIINNCDSQLEASGLSALAKPNIFYLDTPTKLSAGMAKNYGLSACNGQIIAQFDCDCFHAADRLMKQAIAMFKNSATVCVLTECYKYSYISGHASMQCNNQNAILSSMVYVRPNGIDYANIDKQEERSLMEKLIHSGYQAISLPMPELMVKLVGEPTNDISINSSSLTDEQQIALKNLL